MCVCALRSRLPPSSAAPSTGPPAADSRPPGWAQPRPLLPPGCGSSDRAVRKSRPHGDSWSRSRRERTQEEPGCAGSGARQLRAIGAEPARRLAGARGQQGRTDTAALPRREGGGRLPPRGLMLAEDTAPPGPGPLGQGWRRQECPGQDRAHVHDPAVLPAFTQSLSGPGSHLRVHRAPAREWPSGGHPPPGRDPASGSTCCRPGSLSSEQGRGQRGGRHPTSADSAWAPSVSSPQ